MENVIYDGDMGGDDLWAIAILLAHEDKFNILGISTVFGNVSQPYATQNILNFLHWLRKGSVPVAQGEDLPIDGLRPFGDAAYGANGVGGVQLPQSPNIIEKTDIADWYAARVDEALNPVTIFATGPATNLARFAEKYPEKLSDIKEIVFMGGALKAPGKDGKHVIMANGEHRIGNITPYAEFNAYQDPAALNFLLSIKAPVTFMAADATQFMVLTPERQDRIRALHQTYYGPALCKMLMAVEELDRTKFGVDGPFIHDPNVITYVLAPKLYRKELMQGLYFTQAPPSDERRGQATILPDKNTHACWATGITDAEAVFDLMESSLRQTIERAAENPKPLAE